MNVDVALAGFGVVVLSAERSDGVSTLRVCLAAGVISINFTIRRCTS
jgi:hypothetical protein